MRTKHILTAMVLPALFAACTADDFETVNIAGGDSQRPMLSGVTLTTVDGADTRYAVEEGAAGLKFNYESGDQIGAAIIDHYDPTKKPAEWEVENGLGGVSTPFTYDASTGVWSSVSSIGVGHYIFAYPYNARNIQRNAVGYELPVIQKLYQEEDGEVDLNAAIERGNMAIFSTLLEDEEDVNVEAYMRNMFAYPTFRVNIDNGEKASTVSQIVLEYNDANNNGFVVESGLNNPKVYAYFSDDDDMTLNDHYDAKTKTTDWDAVQTADLILDPTDKGQSAYLTDVENSWSKYIIAKFPKNTEFKRDGNTDNKYVDVRFMIPGALKSAYNGKLKMYIYTDNGIFKIDDVWGAIKFNKTTDNATQKRALARNTSYTLTLDKEAVTDGGKYIVTTVDDWNELVSEYGNSKNFAKSPLPVEIVGDEFAFGEDTEMPEVAIFEISTPVSVKGDVTMSNVQVKETVTIEKGATLTTSAKFAADVVENEGTLVIDVARNANNKIVNYGDATTNFPGITAIFNEGTLEVNEKAVATFKLYNEAEATVTNNGEISIQNTDDEGRTADDDSQTELFGNLGTIENNGEINIIGDFDNTTEYAKAEAGKDPEVVNAGVIENKAGAKILASNTVNCELANYAVINNAGEMTSSNKNGKIVNYNEMNVETTSTTYITTNDVDGVIVVKSVDTDNLSIENSNGLIKYTTKAATDNFKDSQINWLVIDPSVTAYTVVRTDGGTFKQITTQGNVTLSYGQDSSKKDTPETVNSKLIVEKGTMKVGSNMTVEAVAVKKNATIDVPATKIMTISGNTLDELKGSIIVGGELNMENIAYDTKYDVRDYGGKGVVTWKDVDAANLKEAMGKAVALWGDNFDDYISAKTYYDGNPYDVAKFAETMAVWANQNADQTQDADQKADIEAAQALAKVLEIKAEDYSKKDAWLEVLTTDDEHKVAISTFTTAIDDLVEGEVNDLKKVIVKDDAFVGLTLKRNNTKFFEDQTDAYNDLREAIAKAQNLADSYLIQAGAWALTDSEIEGYLNETGGEAPYMYVWDGSKVDEAVALWTTYTAIPELDAVSYAKAQTKNGADLVSWINAALSLTSTNNPNITAIHNKLSDLGIDAKNASEKVGGYSSEQITLCINGLQD